MSSPIERRGSARHDVVDAIETGRYDGVMMSIRALRAKAEDERLHGRLGGAFAAAADYLERALAATTDGTPP